MKRHNDRIVIQYGGAVYRVELRELIYGEKRDRKIFLVTKNDTYTFWGSLKNVTALLDQRFLLCHSSYFFNMDYIKKMEHGTIYMAGGYEVHLGRETFRRGKNQFIQYLLLRNPILVDKNFRI